MRFVAELKGPGYRRFLRRLLGAGTFDLTFHWHYTPNGCDLSAHCDAEWKLGSHIFHLNTTDDWDQGWGGQTSARRKAVIVVGAGRTAAPARSPPASAHSASI